MNRYEIIVQVNDENRALDTFSSNPISLNYNISDIKDISSRKSSFSKTINVPETGNNRQIFEDIGSLISESDFNPNKKTKCWVLVDSVTVFKGFLQIRNVKLNKNTGKTEYELVIYADNDNFFKEIGDDFLTDLDFSELNHIWNAENITNSWTASTTNGYYYPLIDYGYNWGNTGNINGFNGSQVDVRKMFPATNVKYIVDKIFSSVNYQYESEFLNSDIFTNLYIPFNQKEFTRTGVLDTDQLFSVGMTGSITLDTGTVSPPFVQLQNPVVLGTYKIPFNNENSPYGDPNNLYDTTIYEYEAPSSGFISQRFVCDFNLTFRHGLQLLGIGAGNTVCTIRFKRSKSQNGIDIPPTFNNPTGGRIIPVNGSIATIPLNSSNFNLSFGITASSDPVTVTGQISTDLLDDTPSADGRFLKLFPNEKVWVEVTTVGDNAQIRADVGVPTGSIILALYDVFTVNTQNIFFNVLSDAISPGELYSYGSAIPKKFKQKDFLTSIIKMFNLYIEPSKEFNNTLIIEPRDEYYQLGSVKDWTKKLDISQDIDIQILGDTQNNEIVLTYKNDTDFYNKDYLERKTAGDIYGQYNEFLDNDFVSGVRKVEPEFSPTPLVALDGQGDAQSNIIIPNIFKENNGTIEKSESKPRILTRFYSSVDTSWNYDDFVFYSDSGQPNNAKTLLTTSGFTNAAHNFVVGDVISITQSDGGSAQPWLNGTFEIVEIPDTLSIVIDKFFVGPGGPAVSGTARPVDGLVGLGPQSLNGAVDRWIFEGLTYSLYPYLGHFNHPLKPNYDINFGQTEGLYYATTLTTNQNLYEVYWKNTLNELFDKSSKIITAKFFLTAGDIADFNFYDIIFVDGQYYKVNKIEYDPTSNLISTVELLKSNYNPVVIKQNRIITPLPIIRNTDGTSPINPIGPIRPDRNPGNVSSSSTNIIQGTGNIVTGKDNIVTNDNNYVAGDDNLVTSKNNIVSGDRNTIDANVSNSLILGDDIVATQNSSLYLDGNLIFDSTTTFSDSQLSGNVCILDTGSSISAEDNVIILGENNIATNDKSLYLSSKACRILNEDYQTILGGNSNLCSLPENSVMIAGYALQNYSNAFLSSNAVVACISGKYTWNDRLVTTDASTVLVSLVSAVAANNVLRFIIYANAREAVTGADIYSGKLEYVCHDYTTGFILKGTPVVDEYSDFTTVAINAPDYVTYAPLNEDETWFEVTGEASTTISWHFIIEMISLD